MYPHLSSTAITWLLVALLTGHVVLVVGALFFRHQLNALYLLCGAFIILAPLSFAPDLPGVYLVKWIRVYVVVLTVVIGLVGFQLFQFGAVSRLLLLFVALYTFAALWSDDPLGGLMYKGLFAVAVVAGVQLGFSARDRAELVRGLRWLGVVAGIAALMTGIVLLGNPDTAVYQQRLMLLGISSNVVGLTAAPLLIFCTFLALYDSSRGWKVFGYAAGIMLVLTILYSGSRGAVLAGAAGCFVVVLPLLKRPGKTFLIVTTMGVIWWIILANVEIPGLQRMIEATEKSEGVLGVARTRLPIWRGAMELVRRSPLLGQGWIHSVGRGVSTRNLHSMYLQVLVETGIVGTLLFAAALLFTIVRGLKMFVAVRRHPTVAHMAALPLALLWAILLHGVGESGALMGSTLNAFMLGYSAGLIDSLPLLAQQETRQASRMARIAAFAARWRWRRGFRGPGRAT